MQSARILGIITARGGSKGLPKKNVNKLAGKPLIAWTIEEAKKSKYISKLILSSEDDEIIHIAKEYGCEVPFKRPDFLAEDDTPGIDPVLHAIKKIGINKYDYIVLLQPTSPLRTVEDIDGCIEYTLEENNNFTVSINETNKSPYWMYKLNNEGSIENILSQEKIGNRRQDLPKTYTLNGALYIAKIDKLLEEKTFISNDTKGYIMPQLRSIDIDSELDFILCEQIIKNKIIKDIGCD